MPTASSDSAIVLVHGLWMTGVEMTPLARRLRRLGYPVHFFRYPTVRLSLADNARALGSFASELEGRAIHFIGHSLGGALLSRFLAGPEWDRPGRAVALGAPLVGTWTGRRVSGVPLLGRALGAGVHEIISRDAPPWSHPRREFASIAGTLPFGAGTFLGGLPSPNDGTVTVEETKLPGLTAHGTVHTNHFGLLTSKRATAMAVNFLESGRFQQAGGEKSESSFCTAHSRLHADDGLQQSLSPL